MKEPVKFTPGPPESPNTTQTPVALVPQTGMNPVYPSRSRELLYDVLGQNPRFIPNKFGWQFLVISRAQFKWT